MVVDNPAMELAFVSEARRSRLSHEQLVAQILALNPSANAAYLGEFTESHLLRYLERLTAAADPHARWTRESGVPGVEGYRRAG